MVFTKKKRNGCSKKKYYKEKTSGLKTLTVCILPSFLENALRQVH